MNDLTKEQKQLADQMTEEIITEAENEAKADNGVEVVNELKKPNPLVDGILEWGNLLDFDALKPNAVLLVKIKTDDPQYSHGFQMGVIRHVLEPRAPLLKQKKITVLFMSDKDDLSTLSEEEMNQAGWTKKDKSIIITPDQFQK